MVLFVVLFGLFAATVVCWPVGYALHLLLRDYRRY